jgi:hypothetical protein
LHFHKKLSFSLNCECISTKKRRLKKSKYEEFCLFFGLKVNNFSIAVLFNKSFLAFVAWLLWIDLILFWFIFFTTQSCEIRLAFRCKNVYTTSIFVIKIWLQTWREKVLHYLGSSFVAVINCKEKLKTGQCRYRKMNEKTFKLACNF